MLKTQCCGEQKSLRPGGNFGPKSQEPPPRKTSKSEPAAPVPPVPVEHPPVVKPAETSSVEMRPVEMRPEWMGWFLFEQWVIKFHIFFWGGMKNRQKRHVRHSQIIRGSSTWCEKMCGTWNPGISRISMDVHCLGWCTHPKYWHRITKKCWYHATETCNA